MGRKQIVRFNFGLPQEPRSSFLNGKSKNGVNMAEVATRAYLQLHRPELLVERVGKFMHNHGWQLIWTPLNMPGFQPIKLFWQHGKQNAIFRTTPSGTCNRCGSRLAGLVWGQGLEEHNPGGPGDPDPRPVTRHSVTLLSRNRNIFSSCFSDCA